MAIRRCPYCKAIIDKSLEYCSNCGTQLLFPEDESIEEEIPGEKIVDISESEAESLKKEDDSKEIETAPDEKEKRVSKPAKKKKKAAKPKKEKTGEEEAKKEEKEKVKEEKETKDEVEAKEKEEAEAKEEEKENKEAKEKEKEEELPPELSEESEEEKTEEEPAREIEKEEGIEAPILTAAPEKEDIPEKDELEEVEEKENPERGEVPSSGEESEEKEDIPPKSDSIKFKTDDLDQLPDARTKDREEMEEILKSFQEEGEKELEAFDEDQTPPLDDKEEEGALPTEEAIPGEPPEEEERKDEPSGDIDIEEGKEEPVSLISPEEAELPEYMKAPPEAEETGIPPEGEKVEPETEDPYRVSEEEEKEKEDIEKFIESVKKEREQKARDFKKAVMPTPEGGWEDEETHSETPEEDMTPQMLIELEEKEKEDIKRFVRSVKEGRQESKEPLTSEEEIPGVSEAPPGKTTNTGVGLPPWAEKIKKSAPPELKDTEEEKRFEGLPEDEETSEEEKKAIQEQEVVPEGTEFTPQEVERVPEEKVPVQEMEVEVPEEEEEEVPQLEKKAEPEKKIVVKRPPSRFIMRLKSRTFDLSFMAVIWLLSLWVASRLIGVTLFSLISITTLPVVGFYLIILLVYFTFFRLFLGETLGDLIFYQD